MTRVKYFSVVFIISVLTGFQCEKDIICQADLSIIEAQTPQSAIVGTNLRIPIRCEGSDLCYRFLCMDIQWNTGTTYDVWARSEYPCSPTVCAQGFYYADTAINIIPPVSGQYVFRYYKNDQTLFRADTVMVN